MPDRDVADSPLASYRPDIAGECDTLSDFLAEEIASFSSPLPRTPAERVSQFMAILAKALKSASLDDLEQRSASPGFTASAEIIEGLRLLQEDRSSPASCRLGMRAHLFLKQLGLCGESDQEIADLYGVVSTRSCVQAMRRKVEEKTGIRSRASKSDEAREACRARRIGHRRPRIEFRGLNSWLAAGNRSLPLVLPVAA